MNYLIVGIGGVIGAILRYLVGKIFKEIMKKDYSIAILFINVVGSFLVGYFSMEHLPGKYRLFFIAGLLGGFTSYSTFMLETVKYIKRGKYLKAFVYLFVSLFSGLFAAGLGLLMTRLG